MAARAIWKGVIRFADVAVPVKLYSAVQDRVVHFRLLNAKTTQPVRQHMVTRDDGEVVESEAIRKGFEAEDGVFVMLDPDELEAVQPKPSRDIEVTRFVDPHAISHQWYDRPYWLGPDGDEDAYFGLVQALTSAERQGVARWTMRRKRYAGALRAEGDYLMLNTLRYAGEVIPVSALPAPSGRDLDEREIAMAKQLVGALSGEFDPAAFRDEYRERVLDLVETKAEGGEVRLPRVRRKRAADDDDLADVLAASLAEAKEGRSAA